MNAQQPENPLGLVMLGGALPRALAETLVQNSVPFHCLCIDGLTDSAVYNYPHTSIRFLKVGEGLAGLRKAGCKKIAFVGQFFRPDFLKMRIDATTLKYLPLFLFSRTSGDNAVLKRVTKAFEKEGFEVISLKEIVPALVAPQGQMGRHALSASQQEDAMLGLKILETLGGYDIGQALVVDSRRVIAMEAAEGTDEMLFRVHDLRKSVRYPAPKRSGVLIKAAKPQQHLRDDMPVIGLDTVRHAVDAGLSAIAVEAGRVLTADLPDMIEYANQHKLAIIGIGGQ